MWNDAILAGVWLREKAYSGNDSVITVVSTTTSPAAIQRFPISGGGLQKSTTEQPVVERRAVRIWKNKTGKEFTTVFDFGTFPVEVLREKETGNALCVLKLSSIPKSASLVSQIDSLVKPIQVEVERGGNIIRSYAASEWKTLSSKNIHSLQAGDILYLKVAEQAIDTCWGYEEVKASESGLNKESNETASTDILIPVEFSVSVYPNPFNPSTTFKISLPEAKNVRLRIYSMLGQRIATVIDGEVQAGYKEFRFDARSLSSGMYLYRLEAGKEVRSGKIMFLK